MMFSCRDGSSKDHDFTTVATRVEQTIGEHLDGTRLKKTRTPGESQRSCWCDFEGFGGRSPRPVIRELTVGLPGNLFDKPTIPGYTLLHIFLAVRLGSGFLARL